MLIPQCADSLSEGETEISKDREPLKQKEGLVTSDIEFDEDADNEEDREIREGEAKSGEYEISGASEVTRVSDIEFTLQRDREIVKTTEKPPIEQLDIGSEDKSDTEKRKQGWQRDDKDLDFFEDDFYEDWSPDVIKTCPTEQGKDIGQRKLRLLSGTVEIIIRKKKHPPEIRSS